MDAQKPLYGLMAEFDGRDDARRRREADPRRGLPQGRRLSRRSRSTSCSTRWTHNDHRLPLAVLLGGIAGACAGFGLCYWVSVIAYPLNIGGRPFNSWPSFIPVTFEVTILLASFTAVVGMIVLNGLPMPYHPVFNVKRFAERASQDGLFLAIEADDPKFDSRRRARSCRSLEHEKSMTSNP